MRPKQLTRRLAFRSDSTDAIARTMTAVVATEAMVDIFDYRTGDILAEVLLLDGLHVADQVPLLLDHDRSVSSQVGSVTDFARDVGDLRASLRFATGPQLADEAFALATQKHLRSVSVGYRVLESEEIHPGQSATIRGQTFTASVDRPLRITTRWTLKEVSLVTIPAHETAGIRNEHLSQRKQTMQSRVLDAIGPQVGSMRWPEFFAVGLKQRNQTMPPNDVGVVRAALSTVEGVSDLVGVITSSIMSGFQNEPDSTVDWVKTVDLPDFLPAQIAAADVAPRMERLSRGDTAPIVGFGVSVEGWRLGRFALSVVIDEQDLTDGRVIGVFDVALEEIGRAARQMVPDLVYGLLLANGDMADGTAIFDASRSNTGTAALASAALDGGMAAINGQTLTDADSDVVHRNLTARYLIVPGDLHGPAKRFARLMRSGNGDLFVRAESRISAAGLVDPATDQIVTGSATNWFLTSPSDQAASVVIGSLNGDLEPSIRHYELKNGEWGRGVDLVFDLAAAVVDATPMYFSNGTV